MFAKNKKYAGDRALGEGQVREIVDEMLRTAFAEQARDLEKHFIDIHKRLIEIEKKSR